MSAIVPTLSATEARALTDEVREDAAALWGKLRRLHDGKAHLALGYSSWASYCAAEFDMGKSHAYRVLDAARVVDALPQSPIGERPSESVAREMVPVLRDDPTAVASVWAETVQEHGPTPTAKQVRDVVQKRAPEQPAPSWVVRIGLVADELRRIARDPHGNHGRRVTARRLDLHTALGLLADAEQELRRQLQLSETAPTPRHLTAVEAAQEHVAVPEATRVTGDARKGQDSGDPSADRAQAPSEHNNGGRSTATHGRHPREEGAEARERRNEGSPGAEAREQVAPLAAAPPCGRAEHVGWEWRAVSGVVQCGRCHVPAAPELVAEWGPRWGRC